MNSPINCHFTKVGKGPGLFLIHGIGASEDAWRFVTPELEKYFTVITYDLRGHGQSSVTHKNFTLEELVNDLEQIRKQSKIPIGVGFGIKNDDDVKKVSKLADLGVCGSSIVEKIKEGSQKGLSNQNLAQFIGEYVKVLSEGVKH